MSLTIAARTALRRYHLAREQKHLDDVIAAARGVSRAALDQAARVERLRHRAGEAVSAEDIVRRITRRAKQAVLA